MIDRWAIQIEVAGDSVLSRIAPSGGSGSERHRPSGLYGDAQFHSGLDPCLGWCSWSRQVRGWEGGADQCGHGQKLSF